MKIQEPRRRPILGTEFELPAVELTQGLDLEVPDVRPRALDKAICNLQNAKLTQSVPRMRGMTSLLAAQEMSNAFGCGLVSKIIMR